MNQQWMIDNIIDIDSPCKYDIFLPECEKRQLFREILALKDLIVCILEQK